MVRSVFIRHEVALWKILVGAALLFLCVAAWYEYTLWYATNLNRFLQQSLAVLCILYFVATPIAIFRNLGNSQSALLKGIAVILGVMFIFCVVFIAFALALGAALQGGAPLG